MDVNVIRRNFDNLLSEPASKDNVHKVRDAINYTASSGLSNLNRLIDAIKSDGNSDVHDKLCSDLYTIGIGIDKLFSNNIDLNNIDYSKSGSTGEFLIGISSVHYKVGSDKLESVSAGLSIDGNVYKEYLTVDSRGNISKVLCND